ncbi:hypothetical protein [Terriglobus sp.]|uniref:hypothetical protein n=1 Tax=Terriglobus sp. TaxID=1889013 RepID=UPI003B004392
MAGTGGPQRGSAYGEGAPEQPTRGGLYNPVLMPNDMRRLMYLARFPVQGAASSAVASTHSRGVNTPSGTAAQRTMPPAKPNATKRPTNRAGMNKCGLPIMQAKYVAIFVQMGRDLGVNPLFVMASAVQESGWTMPHVFGTNKLSNGKPLNNLFGMTAAGGDNLPYPSVEASAKAWEADWGPYLAHHPQTIQAYAAALNSNKLHMYNSNPSYPGEIAKRYKQLVDAAVACDVPGLQASTPPTVKP